MSNNRRIGNLGERIAEAFLVLKGYEILRRNFRYAGREIDLLVRRGTRLVAVEVKLRRGSRFGHAVEAIDERKVARIRMALEGALGAAPRDVEPRIDVVVIDVAQDLSEMVIRHIEAIC